MENPAPRGPSEAFPAIPKAVLMPRKSDARHKPLRPSPLSGNRVTSPTFKSTPSFGFDNTTPLASAGIDEGEETKTSTHDVPLMLKSDSTASIDSSKLHENSVPTLGESSVVSKHGQEQSSRANVKGLSSTDDSESETTTRKEPGYSSTDERALDEATRDDDIAKLERVVDAKLAEIRSVEKKLLETKRNVEKFVKVVTEKLDNELVPGTADVERLRQDLYSQLSKLDGFIKQTIALRDREIDKQTSKLAEDHVLAAEALLERLETIARELEIKRATSYWWWLKTIVFWSLSFAGALVALLVLLVAFSEEEDVQWILVPLKTMAKGMFQYVKNLRPA